MGGIVEGAGRAVGSVLRDPVKTLAHVGGYALGGPAGAAAVGAAYGAKEGGLTGAFTGGVGSYFGGTIGNSLLLGAGKASNPQYGSSGVLSAPNFNDLRELAIAKTQQAFDIAGVYRDYDYQSNIQKIMRRKYISLHDKHLFEPWKDLVKPKKKNHMVVE